jgi:hypothetical protein
MDIVQAYLPVEKKKRIKKKAKNNFSISFAKSAYRILKKEKNKQLANQLVKGSLKLNVNPRNLYWIICMYVDLEYLRKKLKHYFFG